MERSSGILLPIFSLPSKYGIGDLGENAYKFVDILSKARQKYWQVLPINPIEESNSPYYSTSSFAGNQVSSEYPPECCSFPSSRNLLSGIHKQH